MITYSGHEHNRTAVKTIVILACLVLIALQVKKDGVPLFIGPLYRLIIVSNADDMSTLHVIGQVDHYFTFCQLQCQTIESFVNWASSLSEFNVVECLSQ